MEMGCWYRGFPSGGCRHRAEQRPVRHHLAGRHRPFEVAIVPMNMHKSERVAEQAQQFYAELKAAGWTCCLDDRKERPG